MDGFSVGVETVPGDITGATVIKVAGPITVMNVGDLLVHLLAAFERVEDVTVDLTGVTEIDAAGLQLLCSCHRTSVVTHKGFHIAGRDRPSIRDAARISGQLRTTGCSVDTHHTCLWTGGRS